MTTTSVLVSEEAIYIFRWVCFAVLCELVDILGTGTNIINVICFVKQGFKDPVNVSLLGLAISDLGCLVTLIWTNLCLNPLFQESVVTFETIEISYLTAGWPHVMFTRVTSWITALITLERCLCVTVPLKVFINGHGYLEWMSSIVVKNIITPKRATIIIIGVFFIFICGVSPIYYANRLGVKYFPSRNTTMLGLVYVDGAETVEQFTFAFVNVFIPITAFLVIISCTITLVVKLHEKAEWRARSTNSEASNVLSDRDQKVAKMVVVISVLFIVCFTPICFTFIVALLFPEISTYGKYRNTLLVFSGVGFFLESLNSSVNIFIYYKMSTRYRTAFHEIFARCQRHKKS